MVKEHLSWEEKLRQGKPLSELEETKYAATRNTLRRIHEAEEERKYAEKKANNDLDSLFPSSPDESEETDDSEEVPATQDSNKKKGN